MHNFPQGENAWRLYLITRSQHLSLSESSLTASQTTGLKWLTQPTPQTVEVGSSVSFTCSADYKKILEYEWEHDNVKLPGDGRYTLKNDGQTLEISQTKFEDRGDYRCVATRRGKVLDRSQNAELNVKGTSDTMRIIQGVLFSFLGYSLLCHFLRFQGACFLLFLRGAAKWSVVQSIARVLKSFYNNGVSVSEEAIESHRKCNGLELKYVTKNKSFIRAFSALNRGIGPELTKLLLKSSWKASLLEF